jgi:hypothetical protein
MQLHLLPNFIQLPCTLQQLANSLLAILHLCSFYILLRFLNVNAVSRKLTVIRGSTKTTPENLSSAEAPQDYERHLCATCVKLSKHIDKVLYVGGYYDSIIRLRLQLWMIVESVQECKHF